MRSAYHALGEVHLLILIFMEICLVISEGIQRPPNQALQANDHAVTSDASGVSGVVVIAELGR